MSGCFGICGLKLMCASSQMAAAQDMETTESMLFQEPTDTQPASQRSASSAPFGPSQNVNHKDLPRPRSSLGFRQPSRVTGSQRGILDELCARRELPFKSADEQDEQYCLQEQTTKGKTALSSSPGGKALSSDSDPFGGSSMTIPIGSRTVGKLQSIPSRSKRPRSASGLVIRRPTRLPSRSPDIFDRMSSSPPSGGGEPSSGEEEQGLPLRLRRTEAKGVSALGDDLSDTDVEDAPRTEKRARRPSSGTSGEYAPPSSTSTSRTMMFLATPMNKVESEDAAASAATEHTSAGRSLRFVPSSANASAGKKRKLELTEEEDKENTAASACMTVNASAAKSGSGVRPPLGRIASLDYYAGSPAKRSCSLGAEARRLSRVMSKYQQKASPFDDDEAHLDAVTRPRHALGELKSNRKLNGTSSAHQSGKAGRQASSGKYGSDKGQLGLGSAPGVVRSLSVGNLEAPRATDSFLSGGRTEDEECARLLLGLGSSR